MTPEQTDFLEKFRALLIESQITVCEKLELTLLGLGRLAVAEGGDVEVGLHHLNGHIQNAAGQIWEEEQRKLISFH